MDVSNQFLQTLYLNSVEYERLESYVNSLTASQVVGENTMINNLLPATNYSIRVRGQTSAGFGPWSSPITCSTEEDSEYDCSNNK